MNRLVLLCLSVVLVLAACRSEKVADGEATEVFRAPVNTCLKLGERPTAAVAAKANYNPCCDQMRLVSEKNSCGGSFVEPQVVCAACGDGTCDANLENSCNCAEDCGPSDIAP